MASRPQPRHRLLHNITSRLRNKQKKQSLDMYFWRQKCVAKNSPFFTLFLLEQCAAVVDIMVLVADDGSVQVSAVGATGLAVGPVRHGTPMLVVFRWWCPWRPRPLWRRLLQRRTLYLSSTWCRIMASHLRCRLRRRLPFGASNP